MPDLPVIPVICGPTGSGKTAVSLEFARDRAIEVVSADSRQVYRYLNIGTAKPPGDEQGIAPVHCIDLIEPGQRYSAYQYLADAEASIRAIFEHQHLPVVVGGTGLYIQALIEGVVAMDDPDPSLRERLEAEMEELGAARMHARLSEIDPREASRIHPNNRVRVIRALEICEATGICKSELLESGGYRKLKYEFETYCLLPPREAVYRAIEARVDRMMAEGLLKELQALVEAGRGEAIRRSRVIGYAELLDVLERNVPVDEAVAAIKQNTRRFAKRQITWFRNQLEGRFFADSAALLRELLKDYPK